MILQNSLIKKAKTAITATLTPAQMSQDQTFSMLRFAMQPGEDHHHACASERGSRQPNKVLFRELSRDRSRHVAV
jgi:hypothetical protein